MDADQQARALLASVPFPISLGIELRSATKDEVHAILPWADTLRTTGDMIHGGALMSLADTAGAICAYLNLPPGANTTTIESKTNFLRPARGQIMAVARPLQVGRRIIVVQTDLLNEDGKRVAQTTQTQAVLQE